MSYFDFDGKKVFYEESGAGEPLIFLHGNTASSKMFAHIAENYSQKFKVILIDFLGHGKSDRLDSFPTDLWFYESRQVIAFLKEKQYTDVNIIGSSGGAIVAINVALDAPELIKGVIADSFAGESANAAFTDHLLNDRETAIVNPDACSFYEYMHGFDWKQIVENDTAAIVRHQKELGQFFHRSLHELSVDILLTGSKEDQFMYGISEHYYEKKYGDMLKKMKNGRMHLFSKGDHPAMISNFQEFYPLSVEFLMP